MKINLREEETNAYTSFFREYLEQIQSLNQKLMGVFNEIMLESKYDKLQRQISNIIDTYMETIAGKIKNGLFMAWEGSDGSLRSCLRTYRAGEAADEICAQVERYMEDLTRDILKIEKMNTIVTERPIVSEDGLVRLEDVCSNSRVEIQNISEKYIALAENRNTENEIYGTLCPLFKGVQSEMDAFLEASLNSFIELHEFVKENVSRMQNIFDENESGNKSPHGENSVISGAGASVNPSGIGNGDSDIDAYLFSYITESILGKTILYCESIWYRDKSREKRWRDQEEERLPKRDDFIKTLLKRLSVAEKQEWKYMIKHKAEVSGRRGYKTEGEYLRDLGFISNEHSGITELLSKVERARLWQGSFKVGQHVNQYSGRDNYTFDTLEECTKLYKLQVSFEREAGNYFFGKKEFNRLRKMSASDVYDALQLCAYYGDEDHGNMKFGFRRYFMEYEVKLGETLDIARGIIAANGHLSRNKSAVETEQIFVTSEDFKKLEDFTIHEVRMEKKDFMEEFDGTIYALASNMNNQAKRKSLGEFKKITRYLYDKIYYEEFNYDKVLSYTKIKEIMPIYETFYQEYGELLQDGFDNRDEREKYRKREYVDVTKENGNERFFEGDGLGAFKNYAASTYTVFNRVARMLSNIASACEKGKANDTNLVYGAYVLFNPIINGYILEQDGNEIAKFNEWASSEFVRILNINEKSVDKRDIDFINGSKEFEKDEFNEDNIKLFIHVVEIIVNQVGVDELNSFVKKHYDTLRRRKAYSNTADDEPLSEQDKNQNDYGRYTVTKKSLRDMAYACKQTNEILEPINKFYKEKFKDLGDGFDKLNAIIHQISIFCGLWGKGTWDLSKLFSVTDSDTDILKKVQLGGLDLVSSTTAGKIFNGGVHMLKILDWAIPHLKKSRLLVRLNEKIWNLTRHDIQIPYYQKMMDQYMMEHYERKYGMKKWNNSYFEYIHDVVDTIKDEYQRRVFENSVFAADMVRFQQHYVSNETDIQKNRAIIYGEFLNLIRSGMCCYQDISAGTSNNIVDQLYNIYFLKEQVTARVDFNPDYRIPT